MIMDNKNNKLSQGSSSKLPDKDCVAKDADIDLNKAIKITTPGVLIVFSAICIFLAGFIVWSSVFNIETTKYSFAFRPQDNKTYCFINVDYSEYLTISKYNKVYIYGKPYFLDTESDEVQRDFFRFTNDENDLLTRGVVEYDIDIDDGDKYYIVPVKDINLDTNTVPAYVVIDQETPLSYLLNYKWGQ